MAKEVSSLKKAYCPHCKIDNELEHIFFVSPDAEVCYCPNCMREYKPKEVIDNYNYFIANKITKAERLLFRNTKYYEAYCAFAHIIEIDASSTRARFGRILSLIYMSKLRKTNFSNAALMLDNDSDKYFRKLKDLTSYVKFLSRVNVALDEYYDGLYKKITVRERFYNFDCVELYFMRLNEIISFKKLVLDELIKMSAKDEDNKVEKLTKQVQESINILTYKFEDRVVAADGLRYKVAKVVSPSQIMIARLDETLNPISHYVKYRLDENEKRGKLLKDDVYPDNTHISSLSKTMLPLFSIFYPVAIAAFVLTFLSFFKDYKLYLYIGAGASLLVAITFMIIFIVCKVQLSKRTHLID